MHVRTVVDELELEMQVLLSYQAEVLVPLAYIGTVPYASVAIALIAITTHIYNGRPGKQIEQ